MLASTAALVRENQEVPAGRIERGATERLAHRLYHFRLAFSGWSQVR